MVSKRALLITQLADQAIHAWCFRSTLALTDLKESYKAIAYVSTSVSLGLSQRMLHDLELEDRQIVHHRLARVGIVRRDSEVSRLVKSADSCRRIESEDKYLVDPDAFKRLLWD